MYVSTFLSVMFTHSSPPQILCISAYIPCFWSLSCSVDADAPYCPRQFLSSWNTSPIHGTRFRTYRTLERQCSRSSACSLSLAPGYSPLRSKATIHYACLASPDTMIARVATGEIYVVLMPSSSLNYPHLSVCSGNVGHKPIV